MAEDSTHRVSACRLLPAFLTAFVKTSALLSVRTGVCAMIRTDAQAKTAVQRAGDVDLVSRPNDRPTAARSSFLAEAKGFGEKFGKDWGMN
ncbi:MAG TPA: hypothetical protein VKU60_02655, partial [Chloroflexota bacterium]|nr:hypothetical protein [Chloroflexota bacterium]